VVVIPQWIVLYPCQGAERPLYCVYRRDEEHAGLSWRSCKNAKEEGVHFVNLAPIELLGDGKIQTKFIKTWMVSRMKRPSSCRDDSRFRNHYRMWCRYRVWAQPTRVVQWLWYSSQWSWCDCVWQVFTIPSERLQPENILVVIWSVVQVCGGWKDCRRLRVKDSGLLRRLSLHQAWSLLQETQKPASTSFCGAFFVFIYFLPVARAK